MTIGDSFPEVLAAARRGDERATARLYRDVAPLVLGYLRANRVREAEDVAGEVFVSMVRNLRRFSGDERQFHSWLLTIAHRRMVDDLRRSLVRPEDPAPLEGMEAGLPSVAGAEEAVVDHLGTAQLLRAIDGLTPDQRQVVMLRALADLTVPEIARVVGKPETAVKALLRRAVARLSRPPEAAQAADARSGTRPYRSGAGERSSRW
jgi:RNA polymerase sigma factor (sigma-70 family)